MEAAAYSAVGSKYGVLNQDAVLSRTIVLPGGNEVIVALVMDGHGMLGEIAAQTTGISINEHLEEQLTRRLKARSLRDLGTRKLKEVVNTAFQKAHDRVLDLYADPPQEYNFPLPAFAIAEKNNRPTAVFSLENIGGGVPTYSSPYVGNRIVEFGTTVSLALIEKGYMVVAHVGDSDVMVGSLDDHGYVTASPLTKPHSAFLASERFRIAEMLYNDDDDQIMNMVSLREDGYIEVRAFEALARGTTCR